MKKITIVLIVLLSHWLNAQIAIHSFSQTQGTYVPISGGTVVAAYVGTVGVDKMDDVVYNLPSGTIPFLFNFNGTDYDGLNINSNGYITFGATAPANNLYTPISASTAFNGAISSFGVDLEGGFLTSGDRTLGSPDILNVANLGPVQVGDFISGAGIPALTTIVAINGSTITMSANATTTGLNGGVQFGGPSWSNIKYVTQGVAPNRVFVIQYSNFKRFGTTFSIAQHMSLSFQIRLHEADNSIQVVYGDCSPGLTTSTTTSQVGLRGSTNSFATNVNNRLNTKGVNDNWINSAQGTSNASGLLFNNASPANIITSGLTYTWSPPLPCAGTPTAGSVTPASLNICSGSLPGALVLNGFSAGVSGISFQWEQSTDGGANWV
ncbi:MAG: hypothetical protein Q8K02_04170, partial [Flavobacterium sp.]|nr:hypothetical protein [Flavobacterium sp.]